MDGDFEVAAKNMELADSRGTGIDCECDDLDRYSVKDEEGDMNLTSNGPRKDNGRALPSQHMMTSGHPGDSLLMNRHTDDEGDMDQFGNFGVMSLGRTRLWTPRREERMCEMWRQERSLYDSTCQEYRDSYLRQLSLKKIAASLDVTVPELETHMKSLRTIFSKIAHVPAGTAADRLRPRQKVILRICSFLRGHIQTRRRQSNPSTGKKLTSQQGGLQSRSRDSEMFEEDEVEFSPVDNILEFDSDLEEPDDDDDDDITSTLSRPGTSGGRMQGRKRPASREDFAATSPDYTGQRKYRAAKNRTIINDETDLVQQMAKSVTSMAQAIISERNGVSTKEDENIMWGRILAYKLSEMPAHVVAHFKLRVDTLALDAIEGNWP